MPQYHLPNGKVVHTEQEIPASEMDSFVAEMMGKQDDKFPIDPNKLKVVSTNPGKSIIDKGFDLGKQVIANPIVNRGLFGITPENTPGMDPAVYNVKGPGMLEIPGINKGANWLANQIDNPLGEGGFGRGFVAGSLEGLGSIFASGMDPGSASLAQLPRGRVNPINEVSGLNKEQLASRLSPTKEPVLEGLRNNGKMVRQGKFTKEPDGSYLDVFTGKKYDAEGKPFKPGKTKVIKTKDNALVDSTTGEEIPVTGPTPYTPADYAIDNAFMKARGQTVPPEMEALAQEPKFTGGDPAYANKVSKGRAMRDYAKKQKEGELTPQPEVIPKFSPKGKAQEPTSLQDKLNNLLTELAKSEEGSLDLGKLFGRGKKNEEEFSTTVRNALGKAITSGGRVNLDEIYSTVGKGKDRAEFDNIISQMIDSGEAKKLVEGDLNIPLKPVEGVETQSKARQYWDFFRGVKSVDLPFISSAALRQGNYYIGTKAWREQFGKAARAYGSQKAFDAQEAERLAHPYFAPQKHYGKSGKLLQDQSSFAEMAGLRRGGAGFQDDIVQKRELAERIPWYGGHVHRNNRAFTAAVNHLSDTAFTNMVDDFKAIGLDPTKDLTLAKNIAELVNTSVKRGTLGLDFPNLKPGQGKNILAEKSLERSISTISGLLFSPRGIASDMRLLNPSTYWNAPGPVRKELIKGMGRRMSVWLGVAGLAKVAGAEVNLQPTNPDFLKIKIGNTRIDPPAGLQQFIVLAAQNIEGGKTSSNSGKFSQFGEGFTPTRSENALNFLVNRQHPTLRNMWDIGSGSPRDPVHVFDRALRMFTPMFSDDVASAAFEDPELIPIILMLGGGGLGTQTYEKGDKMNAPVYLPEDWDIKFPGK